MQQQSFNPSSEIYNPPSKMQPLFQQAQIQHQAGNWEQAAALYEQVIGQQPKFAEAYHLLGLVYGVQGQFPKAIQTVLKAIQLQPIQPMYYNNLGLLYAKVQSWQLALSAYRTALRFGTNAEVLCNAADAHKPLQQVQKAIECYEKALKINPKHGRAAYNLGNTLLESGKPKSAKIYFEIALQIQPNNPNVHNNLGVALDAWNESETAFQHFQKAVELKPTFPDALKNMGQALLKRGDYQQARHYLYQSFLYQSVTGWESLILAALSPVIFEDTAHIDAFFNHLETALQLVVSKTPPIELRRLHEMRLEPASVMPYQGRNLLKIQQLYGQLFAKALPAAPQKRISNPLRPHIGFVVTHGHEGVFWKCMRGILNQINPLNFQVTIVCSQPHGKAILKADIHNAAIQYLEISREMHKACQEIEQARLDVLHYWEVGTDYQNYFLPFFRLAPIQSATWGWPVTTGIPTMDYFVSSEGLESPNADAHYTERLIRLKKLPTYYYRPQLPTVLQTRTDFGLPKDSPLYLVAQNLRKVHPDFDEILFAILEKDRSGMILLIADEHAPITTLLQNRFIKHGSIHATRIRFMPRMDASLYLNLLAIVDVILDTLYYTGGANTSYDAIAVGTPYVTLPMVEHRSRYGAAAYQQIGVTDTIACNSIDYVEKAFQIANDKAIRQALKGRILEQAHLVFEDLEAVRELETFFKQAINEYTATTF